MRLFLLAGTAFLQLAASGLPVGATAIDFSYTGSLVTFAVPATGSYQILAYGAQGGSGFGGFNGITAGGQGAKIGGDFSLTGGEILEIAVGGAGLAGGEGGAGGGGSFVVGPANTPLVIAGGGGGAGGGSLSVPGQGGLAGLAGGATTCGAGAIGNGGAACEGPSEGGGGGGFLTAGESSGIPSLGITAGTGGEAFPELTGGGPVAGGYGGGGGALLGAGGGGGYSGGSGNFVLAGGGAGGGGGGSFDAGADQVLTADFQAGNGAVVITQVSEPATLALRGAGLLSVIAVRCRRPNG